MSLEIELAKTKSRLLKQRWSPDRVDDALQEAVANALEAGLPVNRLPSSWLYVAAKRAAINSLKHDSRTVLVNNLNAVSSVDDYGLVDLKLDSHRFASACEELLHPSD